MILNKRFSYSDICVTLDKNYLTVENSCLKRVFDLALSIPRTTSLINKSLKKELIANESTCGDFSFIGFNMPHHSKKTEYSLQNIEIFIHKSSIFDSEHIEIKCSIQEKVQQLFFSRCYLIYSDLPVVSTKTSISAKTSPNVYWNKRENFNNRYEIETLESVSDRLCVKEIFQPKKAIEFRGRTDYFDDLVIEHDIASDKVNGNILFCSNNEGQGLIILQEAPPSNERRDFEPYDFRINGKEILSCGWGIEPQEVCTTELTSYRNTLILFGEDSTSGTSELKRYFKVRFPVDIKKNCTVMVNPWGGTNFLKRVNEQFIKDELSAAADLNATHYQIDDGWEKGDLAELATNNRYCDKEFWTINPELFPNDFEPVISHANQVGIRVELWTAPSSNQHYNDWQEFGDILLQYHNRYGINFFKLDNIKTRTKKAEDNLEKLLRYLREKSNGNIYFNLDTTNGQRPGYFLFLEYGNVFLENRYINHDGPVGYHPEKTLNNLWKLSQYMRPQSLQIEFPDPGLIDHDYYSARGLSAPDVYSPEYWAGITLFANPLAWLAPSVLKNEHLQIYKKVISLHRKYSEEIFQGEIFPIGDEPNGSNICGFQSHNDKTGEGLFIVYREINAPNTAEVELKLLNLEKKFQIFELSLEGESEFSLLSKNKIKILFQNPGSWKLFRYKII